MAMSIANSEDLTLRSIRTRHSEEFRLSSRRLSREFPIVDSSFDVYYGESSVGVPFLWESAPGTPKFDVGKYPLPPLTPPPSFHSSPNYISRKPLKKQSRNTLLIIPKINTKKSHLEQSPPSGSTSSSSLSPWSTTNLSQSNRHRVSSPPRRSFDSRYGGRNEEEECQSPVSTLCFGGGRRGGGGRSPGCSSSIMRLLLRDF